MIDSTKFQIPSATLAAAYKVADTIQDQDRRQKFLTSLLADVPLFYRVAIAQEFFEQLPIQSTPHFPDKATMFFRMGLILEELKETFLKGLGIELELSFTVTEEDRVNCSMTTDSLEEAIKWSTTDHWDLDEFADGLSDMKVVIDGTGVICAIPMDLIDWDNHCANMSKLGDDARPQINGVTPGFRSVPSRTDNNGVVHDVGFEPGYRPDLPIGKWIKGPNYVPANPSRIMGLEDADRD